MTTSGYWWVWSFRWVEMFLFYTWLCALNNFASQFYLFCVCICVLDLADKISRPKWNSACMASQNGPLYNIQFLKYIEDVDVESFILEKSIFLRV